MTPALLTLPSSHQEILGMHIPGRHQDWPIGPTTILQTTECMLVFLPSSNLRAWESPSALNPHERGNSKTQVEIHKIRQIELYGIAYVAVLVRNLPLSDLTVAEGSFIK
jgi:hypothetical protein